MMINMQDQHFEMPSEHHLPKVDRRAVQEACMNEQSTMPDDINDFYQDHPELESAILGGFSGLPDEDLAQLFQGVGLAAVLINNSQDRTGGIIPAEISADAIDAAIKSIQEESGNASAVKKQLFDEDPELYFGATLLADLLKCRPAVIIQGAHLMRGIYKHIIEGSNLKSKIQF
ncbi:MAG: hypothetical protein V1858_02305 [Candidatus Gottesmanbacteria bacterium]